MHKFEVRILYKQVPTFYRKQYNAKNH